MDEYVKKQDILDNLEWHDKNCGEMPQPPKGE